MSTEYETILRQKRAEILETIEEARRQAAEVASRITLKEAQLKNIDDLLALESGSLVGDNIEQVENPADPLSGSLTDQAAEVLRTAARPTHYRQIVALLADRGVYVPGKDPGANLIAHVSRDDRFVRTGRGIYGLSEWPSVSATRKGTSRSRSRRKPRAKH